MHMANELLSPSVAAGTYAIAAGGLGLVCRQVRRIGTAERLSLMGVLGAFVFAAQMVNIPLPGLPGTSGHMVGAALLAILLGPATGALVLSSVVIVQCLIFQDGGLLALGCNILNIALIPCFVGYSIYRPLTTGQAPAWRTSLAAVAASLVAVEAGAMLVPVQAALSGVLLVPVSTFLITMMGVHLLLGLLEGVLTATVLAYLRQVRPDLLHRRGPSLPDKGGALVTLAVATLLIAGGLSLLASDLPDGLEWSYAERPDQPDFKPIVSNESSQVNAVDALQSRYTPLPNYSRRRSPIGLEDHGQVQAAGGWTSVAGVTGSLITMGAVWLGAAMLRRPNKAKAT